MTTTPSPPALESLPLRPSTNVQSWGPTIVVAPHPDDESIGCGGAIRLLRDADIPVRVIFVSDGSGSHPNSRRYPPERLRSLREREALAALAELGVPAADARFLGLPDRFVPTADDAGFAGAVALMIAALSAPWLPATILVPWRRDPHGDHRASWQIVVAAIRRLPQSPRIIEYPVWIWDLGDADDFPTPDEMDAWQLDITSVIEQKLAAIAAHRSQTTSLIDDDPDGFMLPAEMLRRAALPREIYMDDQEIGADEETDR